MEKQDGKIKILDLGKVIDLSIRHYNLLIGYLEEVDRVEFESKINALGVCSVLFSDSGYAYIKGTDDGGDT